MEAIHKNPEVLIKKNFRIFILLYSELATYRIYHRQLLTDALAPATSLAYFGIKKDTACNWQCLCKCG